VKQNIRFKKRLEEATGIEIIKIKEWSKKRKKKFFFSDLPVATFLSKLIRYCCYENAEDSASLISKRYPLFGSLGIMPP